MLHRWYPKRQVSWNIFFWDHAQVLHNSGSIILSMFDHHVTILWGYITKLLAWQWVISYMDKGIVVEIHLLATKVWCFDTSIGSKHNFNYRLNVHNTKHHISAFVKSVFFATKEELYYIIAGYINTLQALWITHISRNWFLSKLYPRCE